jgi:predicted DNA-binding transcriptional regulator AlpA
VTEQLLSARKVKERYDVSRMCLWRWERDPEVNFPAPLMIRKRLYWRQSDLEAWERDRIRKRPKMKARRGAEARATA